MTLRASLTVLGIAAVLLPPIALSAAPDGGRAAVPGAIEQCDGAGAIDFGCYERRYRALAAAHGPGAAISDLRERAVRVGYVRAACHQLMHGIGRDAGRRRGIEAFDQGDDTCSSGFFHGVVEAVMARIGARRIDAAGTGVCALFRAREARGFATYNCIHGMGHGFMDVYGGDVFRSLRGCEGLPGRWERDHCVGGVFMENLTARHHAGRPARHLRPKQPLYPCTAVAPRYKHECYMKQTAYALYVRDYDFGAVFEMCAASPDVSFRGDCFQGLGGDASIHSSKYVLGATARRAATRALCDLGPDRTARRNCIVGAITVIVRDGAPQAMEPAAFCTSIRATGLRVACARAHARTVRSLTASGASPGNETGAGIAPRLLCRLDEKEEPR